MGRLLSVNVGLPRDVPWQGKIVNTAVWKDSVRGPVMVRRLNVDGDGQADRAGHGGEHRAVFVYQIQSYRYWEKELDRADFSFGQFGENFTIDGLADDKVGIGDQFRIGEALFEVTQPRVTCYRVGIRMNHPDMAALLVKHGRPGFYFRVLEEGKVAAGDAIVKVASGLGRMSVSEINALLYLPGHSRDRLERALTIPALSAGWRSSFELLLRQERAAPSSGSNAGLRGEAAPPPAWDGFRRLRVAQKTLEKDNVVSLTLEAVDGQPMPTALPGQFIVLRLGSASSRPLIRSYSLSGEPGAAQYRVSIKRRPNGAAGRYIHDGVRTGHIVEASAPRGSFTLRPGPGPVILASAGIGITPVLAMLHALAAEASERQVWWLYGTRNGRAHPFGPEVERLLSALPQGHRFICYSSPDADDRPGEDFDAFGHLDMAAMEKLKLPSEADYYICGPQPFMDALASGLMASDIPRHHVHSELFGSEPSSAPGIVGTVPRAPHPPERAAGSGSLISFARSGLAVCWMPSFSSLLEFAEACDVPVRWSCRSGVCHSCETGLVAGTIGYAPEPIDAPAEGNVLICCSRPQGDIVLDL
ncbi:MOSC and FAD-binding oxidoreductase domain-containing protein [Rhizorhabdus argentea]|uniref:MOSC and FAD-binding oxidoreductase domain-containing protein n=1 Tax=Rhizorhabdus argentea TaxID=1387174 RepID=UPI0030EE3D11